MTSAEAFNRYMELQHQWPPSGRTPEQWARLAEAQEELERIRLLETIRRKIDA